MVSYDASEDDPEDLSHVLVLPRMSFDNLVLGAVGG
jgi:hypothetical protein